MMGNSDMEKRHLPDIKLPLPTQKQERQKLKAKKRTYKVPDGQLDMSALRIGGRRGPGGTLPVCVGSIIREKPENAKGTIIKLLQYIGKNKALIFFLIFIMILVDAAQSYKLLPFKER